jgi:hypothetical protein
MTETYEPISTTTLASGTASVTFSSIPATYTDLVLVTSVQASTTSTGLGMQLNSDTAANYSTTILRGDGTSASSARQSNNTELLLSNIASPPSSSSFGVYIAHFMNYSNTTTYKTNLIRSNSAGFGVEVFAGLWRSTSAISSIKIQLTGGTMAIGSTFTLYGIKAA